MWQYKYCPKPVIFPQPPPARANSSPGLLPLTFEHSILLPEDTCMLITLHLPWTANWATICCVSLASWKPCKLFTVPATGRKQGTHFRAGLGEASSQRTLVAAFPLVFHGKNVHTVLILYFQLLMTKMVIFMFFHVSNFCSWHTDISQSQKRRWSIGRVEDDIFLWQKEGEAVLKHGLHCKEIWDPSFG